ncbi:hypothetical protein H7849_09615 [Alloacidobacterium dinghuense]|uniref:TrbI/VirB10 family protein n=1 Tax=Alloacidobacterium dinghuense TaxID=2763107 RepID=A0A7G8BNK8_9BACT|nr:hypothetical protein [Alloacidobacterium dinghuense]QNI34128.1 hypothetical protein H7849_09615 [Alloacidobacterium dinghuense]
MTRTGTSLALIAFASTLLLAPAGFAQQASQPPNTGVSNPPADDTIVTSQEEPATPPVAKPSPAVPAQPAVAATAPPTSASAAAANPDYGIVTSVSSTSANTSTPAASATLSKRPYNPDEDIVGYVPSPSNELAEGTNIRARLMDTLSTRETNAGTSFKAQVATDVYKDGRIIIPAGSELRGRVVSVSQGHHFGPAATLRLRPDVVILPDGTAYHLYAQVIESKAPNTRTDSEGGIQPSSHLKKEMIEYGAGAGTGAIVGAKIAGPHGAVIGSLVGAGVITVHLMMQHPEIAEVPKGSVVTFSLTEPMDLMPTRN